MYVGGGGAECTHAHEDTPVVDSVVGVVLEGIVVDEPDHVQEEADEGV